MRFRVVCLAAVCLAVAGCAEKAPFADDATINAVRYRDPSNPSMTLYTMINNRTGGGAHTSLMINASERVIFDPAGSFYADIVPERNDVLFGITPRVEEAYRGAHARETFHVVRQTVALSPEQAETAYRLALANGPVAGAFCANATSKLIAAVPGFSSVSPTMYPNKLMEQFGTLPGVTTDAYYEDDDPDLQKGLAKGNAALDAATE